MTYQTYSQAFKSKNNIVALTHADTEVAIAKPTWRNSFIKIKFKIKFSVIEKIETFIGVLVSSLAKKGTTNIFIKIKAGKPKLRAVNADDVSIESSNVNSPLKNKKLIISFDNKKDSNKRRN